MGCPGRVLADRMACLKGGVVANVVIPTAGLRPTGRAITGSAPDFCHADDPQSKGIVENLCGYAQARPGGPAADRGRRSPGRSGGSAQPPTPRPRAWCAEVNAAVHSEICAVPTSGWSIERELLRPLPSLRPADRGAVGDPQGRPAVLRSGTPRPATRCPTRLIGTTVGRGRRSAPRVLLARAGHRGGRGRTRARRPGRAPRSCDAHYDGARPGTRPGGPAREPRWRNSSAPSAPIAEAFLVGAAAIGNTRLGSELEILLALGAAHGDAGR